MIIQTINDALSKLPKGMDTSAARVMLYAIGLQESGFRTRRQYNNGPAAGLWQFEKEGGVNGVLRHHSTADIAASFCMLRGVTPDIFSVWDALQSDDVLAAGFARLLLWTDPKPLPDVGYAEGAWQYYLRCWRPGYPRRRDWDDNYGDALCLTRSGL